MVAHYDAVRQIHGNGEFMEARSQRGRILVLMSILAACALVATLSGHNEWEQNTAGRKDVRDRTFSLAAASADLKSANPAEKLINEGTQRTEALESVGTESSSTYGAVESTGAQADGAGSAGQAAAKQCDAECEGKRTAAEERMKALRDSIYKDFDSMIDYGNEVGYVPPPQSIEQQAKDGTLITGAASENVKAPAFDAPNPLEIAGTAANVELDPSQVEAVKKQLSQSSSSEEKQLEAQVDRNVAASSAPVDEAFLPPGSQTPSTSPQTAPAAPAAPAAPPASAAVVSAPPLSPPTASVAPASPAAGLPHPNHPISAIDGVDPITQPISLNPPSAPSPVAAFPPAGGETEFPRTPASASQAVTLAPPSSPPAAAAPAPAPAAPSTVAVAAPLPLAGALPVPAPSAPPAPQAAPPSPWAKAFAFIKQTHNPLLGSADNELPSTAGVAQPVYPSAPGVDSQSQPGVSQSKGGEDPLSTDGFLKSYFGHA